MPTYVSIVSIETDRREVGDIPPAPEYELSLQRALG